MYNGITGRHKHFCLIMPQEKTKK